MGKQIINEVVSEKGLVVELERVFERARWQGKRQTKLHNRPL